jgi:hypothetical protein
MAVATALRPAVPAVYPGASAFGLMLVSYYASARIFKFTIKACGTQKAARAKPGL